MSWTYVAIEVKRLLSRPAVLFFCVAMPVGFYVLFDAAFGDAAGAGLEGSVNAVFLVSMGVYGAALAAGSATVSVAHERPLGWNRQLRLTPLRPWAYAAAKILAAMIVSALSVAVLYAVGLVWGKAAITPAWWVVSGLFIWAVGSVTFAALGLVVALGFRGETGSAIMIPLLLVCAFLSGVFQIPIDNSVYQTVMQFIPMYGIDQIASAPITGQPAGWSAWANAIVWLVSLSGLAVILFRRDTARQ
jgi:ABC-2 type transport system permease protein